MDLVGGDFIERPNGLNGALAVSQPMRGSGCSAHDPGPRREWKPVGASLRVVRPLRGMTKREFRPLWATAQKQQFTAHQVSQPLADGQPQPRATANVLEMGVELLKGLKQARALGVVQARPLSETSKINWS